MITLTPGDRVLYRSRTHGPQYGTITGQDTEDGEIVYDVELDADQAPAFARNVWGYPDQFILLDMTEDEKVAQFADAAAGVLV